KSETQGSASPVTDQRADLAAPAVEPHPHTPRGRRTALAVLALVVLFLVGAVMQYATKTDGGRAVGSKQTLWMPALWDPERCLDDNFPQVANPEWMKQFGAQQGVRWRVAMSRMYCSQEWDDT